MNKTKLKNHIKLCRKNLLSDRVKCCANCPFEAEIIKADTSLGLLFSRKRGRLGILMHYDLDRAIKSVRNARLRVRWHRDAA